MRLQTPDGDIVVLELKRRAGDRTAGQTCRYCRWVREHRCPPNRRVFRLILAQDVSEPMRYALKGVAGETRVRQLQFELRLGVPWPQLAAADVLQVAKSSGRS